MSDKGDLIGEVAIIQCGPFAVEVRVLDHKFSYGHDRYLVTPVAGSGQAWVEKMTPKEED